MSKAADREPLVSVVIAAHNSAATIAETINSVTRGTYRNIEVIVVDDGSTDATATVVEELAMSDRRIKLQRREWAGVSAAYRAGLDEASGAYVAYLDSDDVWHPTKLEKQIALAIRDPPLAFIYTFVRMIDARGRVLHDVPQQCFPRLALAYGLYEHLVGANSSALVRRSVLYELGRKDDELKSRQDLMMQLDIFARHPVAVVPEYLVGYRYSGPSLSGDAEAMLASWQIISARVRSDFPQIPRDVRRWADARQYCELAESFARKSEFGRPAALFLQSLACDPARVILYGLYRIERRARLALRRSEPESEGPLFESCDPKRSVRPKETVPGLALGLLNVLDRRRHRYLKALPPQWKEEAPRSNAAGAPGKPCR